MRRLSATTQKTYLKVITLFLILRDVDDVFSSVGNRRTTRTLVVILEDFWNFSRQFLVLCLPLVKIGLAFAYIHRVEFFLALPVFDDRNFAIPIYPAYSLTDGVDNENTNGGNDAQLVDDFAFDDATCPMCFIHGDGDGYSAMASVMAYRQLRKMGIPGEMHVYAYAKHAFLNCAKNAPIRKYPQRVYEWLQTLEILEAPDDVKVTK